VPKYVLHNTLCLRHWSVLDSGTNYWYVLQCYYIFPLMVDYLCFQIDWINFEVASHKLLILLHWMTKSVSEWSYLEIIWCIYLRNELIDLMVFMLVIDSYGLIWKIWKVLHKGPSLTSVHFIPQERVSFWTEKAYVKSSRYHFVVYVRIRIDLILLELLHIVNR